MEGDSIFKREIKAGKALISKPVISRVSGFLIIFLLTGAITLASPNIIGGLESILQGEAQKAEMMQSARAMTDQFFRERRFTGIWGEVILQPYEHETPEGEDLMDPDRLIDNVQKEADRIKYQRGVSRYFSHHHLRGEAVETDFLKDGDDIFYRYQLYQTFGGAKIEVIDEDMVNIAVRYLGGFNTYESSFVAALNMVKLANETRFYYREGIDETPTQYEVEYDIPYSEAQNVGGVKNPVTYAYPMRRLQRRNLDLSDELRDLFQNDSLQNIIERIDDGYGSQLTGRLNRMYATNPANPLAKAKVYMTMALNEIDDLDREESMEFVEKAWDLVAESDKLFNDRSTEWYQYLEDTYGEKGVEQFNRQYLILLATTLRPYGLTIRHEELEREDLKFEEMTEEYIYPNMEDIYPDEEDYEELRRRINEIL